MKKLKKTAFVLSALIALLAVAGCEKDNRTWTAIDENGREFTNLKDIRTGIGWTQFKTIDGKGITFRGDHTYFEE